MPKGEGSPSLLGADSLETRMLLSHLTGATPVHVASTTSTAPSTNVTVTSKPEVETGHPATSSTDVQERDDEQVAAAAAQAASSSAQEQFTIPLILNTGMGLDSEDGANPNVSIMVTNRSFRGAYGEEHVAWGGSGSTSVYPMIQSRYLSEVSPQVPETTLVPQLAKVDTPSPVAEKLPDEPPSPLATQGADLLAPYLPIDRGGLEDAIDSLIDGFEVLMGRDSTEAETAELIPFPIACGIGLAGGELVRRWIRRKREADEDLERDPALGFEGWPA